MATTIATTYAGEFKESYIREMLLAGKTLDNGGMTIFPNVAYKEVIQKAALGGSLIVDGSCDYTDSGTLALTERVLEVEEYQVNKTECTKTFSQTWQAAQMQGKLDGRKLPASFSDFIVQYYIAKIAAQMENTIWQGANANPGEFDGITTILAANTASLAGGAVIGAGVAVTAANVIEKLGLVVDNISTNSPALLGQADLRIYVSSHVFQCYIRALGGFSIANTGTDNKMTQWWDGNSGLTYDGIEVFLAPGMPTNDMVATTVGNLFFGCGILDDMSEIRLIDTSQTLGDQNVRFVARWKAGVQVGLLEEVTYYS
tara:strand:- start:661 stop:1605 length:945 start_codon:yes stop_codon:yes gene_type:complete